MEKQLLKEELSRIWEIMGVKGDKTLLRESIIDDLVQMIIKKGAGEADVAVQLAKIQADFPYLKGLTKTDLGKLAKGGVDAAPVIQKIVGKMSGNQLTSLANDIYKNSVDIQDLIKNQMDGLTANIKSGSLDVAGAQQYIRNNVDNWIKPVGGSADNLVAKLKTRLMDELGGQVQDVAAGVGKVGKVGAEVQDEVSQKIDDFFNKLGTEADDETLELNGKSILADEIFNSGEFKNLNVPSNIDKTKLADQVAANIAKETKLKVDQIPEGVWANISRNPLEAQKFLDDTLASFKAKNPTKYEKIKTNFLEWLKKPSIKVNPGKIKFVYYLGVLSMLIYQVKDTINTWEMGGSSVDIVKSSADAVFKSVGWFIVPFIGTGLEKDYYNSLRSFEEFVVDNEGVSEETAVDKVESGDEKGVYYLLTKVGPPNDQKDEWVEYKYNNSLGTFVKTKTQNTNTDTPSNPVTTTTYTNDPAGYQKYAEDKGGTYGVSGNYVMQDGTPFYKDSNGSWQAGSYDATTKTFKTN